MLISVTIENWRCFRDETTFTMVAGREKQHKDRLSYIDKYKMNILPISSIYGGNASGKTSFCSAMSFAKNFVSLGLGIDKRIPREPYLLDDVSNEQESKFIFELLVNEKYYEFGFKITGKEVKEEWLTEVLKTTEKKMFHRTGDKINFFQPKLKKDSFLNFAFNGTRDNQLFLTNSVSQKVGVFEDVFNWFKKNLVVIDPDTSYGGSFPLFDEYCTFVNTMADWLKALGTGIVRLDKIKISLDELPIPEELKQLIKEDVSEDHCSTLRLNEVLHHIVMKDDQLSVQKIISVHETEQGKPVHFDLKQESDGTRRAMDLLPSFMMLSNEDSNSVFIIDELDRSLHTQLSQELLSLYMKSCHPDKRSQLIFTTHDLMLMDQEILRRDEMWVTDRQSDSTASLIAFSDYKDIRKDKDIRKSYLQGRMGGIPNLTLKDSMTGGTHNG